MAFDPGEIGKISEKGLKAGYWWVTHKVLVRRIVTVIIGIIAAVLVVYAGFGFLDWYFGSGVAERANIGTLTTTQTPGANLHQQVQDLSISALSVLDAGNGRYDIFGRAVNPNEDWWAEFDYAITAGGISPVAKHTFILPGATKQLYALGVTADARPAGAQITVSNVVWHRVDAHVVQPDYRTWAGARLNFRLTGVKFVPPDPTDALPVGNAKFTVVNDTGFSYYEVGFFVTLYSGNRIAGVNYVTISDLRAGDERPVDAAWFSSLPNISRVEVTPDVNIFDAKAFIPPGQ